MVLQCIDVADSATVNNEEEEVIKSVLYAEYKKPPWKDRLLSIVPSSSKEMHTREQTVLLLHHDGNKCASTTQSSVNTR